MPGNGDDIVLATFTHQGALAVGQGYNQSETFLLPPAFNGQYHLFVHSDAGNAVFQNGARPDRYAEASNLFDVTQYPYADLVVSSVTAPAGAASGQSMTVSWLVTNQGIGVTDPTSPGAIPLPRDRPARTAHRDLAWGISPTPGRWHLAAVILDPAT